MPIKTLPIVLVLIATAQTVTAALITVDFYHGGFTDGAFVSGSLAGEDADGDGILLTRPGDAGNPGFTEITDFSLNFPGNTILPPFSDVSFGVYDGSVSFNLSTESLTLWSRSALFPEYYPSGGTLTDFNDE